MLTEVLRMIVSTSCANDGLADCYQPAVMGGASFSRHTERRRPQTMDEFEDDEAFGPYQQRKRPRNSVPRRAVAADTIIRKQRAIKAADEKVIMALYDHRLRGTTQAVCKLIAKAWIKMLEPKKQSTHPYTGELRTAPDWWPRRYGPTEREQVRHREPDHLLKNERVHLLCHIIRLVVQGKHQCVSRAALDVKKLEAATNEALHIFWKAKENETQLNQSRKNYLKELFRVAAHEERYLRGEVGRSLSRLLRAAVILMELLFLQTVLSANV